MSWELHQIIVKVTQYLVTHLGNGYVSKVAVNLPAVDKSLEC